MILYYWDVRDEFIKRNLKMTYHDLLTTMELKTLDDFDNEYRVILNYANLYKYSNIRGLNNFNIIVSGFTNIGKYSDDYYRLEAKLQSFSVPNQIEYVIEYLGDNQIAICAMIIKFYERDYEFDFVTGQIRLLISSIYYYNNNLF